MRRLLLVVVAFALCVAVSGCGGGRGDLAASGPLTGTTLHDWPTYQGSVSRSGVVGAGPSGSLSSAWHHSLNGAVYGQPLVVGGELIVATERNWVYALNARSGRVLWQHHLGTPQPLSQLPCGNIDPLGITGTPAYDASTGSVFVVAETVGGHHTLWGLSAKTGSARWHRSMDTRPHRNRSAEQQRGALLVESGRVLVPFGGLAGDCDNYVGYVTSSPVSGRGATYTYAVPTAREAGMWAPPGPVMGRNGNVYVASGNGAELGGRWDDSDSVTELSPVRLRRLSVFAPASWAQDNADDLDLGSTSPAMVPAVHRIVITGKRGVSYLLPERLHGVGSNLASLSGCASYGGTAVAGATEFIPCRNTGSLRALHVGTHSLRWGWRALHAYGTPVVVGQRVYVVDGESGDLVVLDRATGHARQRLPAGRMPHFATVVVSGDWVFVPTLTGVHAFVSR